MTDTKFGTVAIKRAGIARSGGTEWPMRHLLGHHRYGWVVTKCACDGDSSTAERTTYPTEAEARQAFDALPGELEP